jgi:acetolactate synthase I/II/III large subunit
VMKAIHAIAQLLKTAGFSSHFSVTGGAAVHIIDSLEKVGIKGHFAHHEQAAALAADASARLTGFGLCVTTTGPGVTNALTGLLCSWQDSTPTVFISGQSRTSNLAKGFAVRQSGTQHLDIAPIVKPMTKAFIQISDPMLGLQQVAELLIICKSGRPGPVWIDIPLDVQLMEVSDTEVDLKIRASLSDSMSKEPGLEEPELSTLIHEYTQSLSSAKRPVLLLGRGSLGLGNDQVGKLIDKLDIPLVTTWGVAFGSAELHPNWRGRIGVSGMRGANKLVMSSDCILSIGARWGQSTVGTDLAQFAPHASIFVADVDREEISLLKSRRQLKAVVSNASKFAESLLDSKANYSSNPEWVSSTQKYSPYLSSEYTSSSKASSKFMDTYRALSIIQEQINLNWPSMTNYVIDGGGTVVYCSLQSLMPNFGSSLVLAAAAAPMGTGLPQSFGAWVATMARTICFVGDGSLMFNIQELQTLRTHGADVKVIVLSNKGYRSIRSTQDQFLDGIHLGSDSGGGLEIPEIESIAANFSIKFSKIQSESQLIHWVASAGPGLEIVELLVDPDQELHPRVAFRIMDDGTYKAAPLDDMDPVQQ